MNPNSLRLVGVFTTVAMALTAPAGAAPAPAGRYTYPAPGTVYDTKTKLTWQQTATRGYSGGYYYFAGATTYCAGLGATLGGTGWRLPTIKELTTIVDESRVNPAIDPTAFPGEAGDQIWTSSLVVGSNGGDGSRTVWVVYFGNGSITSVGMTGTNGVSVRCVR